MTASFDHDHYGSMLSKLCLKFDHSDSVLARVKLCRCQLYHASTPLFAELLIAYGFCNVLDGLRMHTAFRCRPGLMLLIFEEVIAVVVAGKVLELEAWRPLPPPATPGMRDLRAETGAAIYTSKARQLMRVVHICGQSDPNKLGNQLIP